MIDTESRVVLHLRIRASKGKRDALLEFLRSAIPFYEHPQGIKVRVLQSVDDRDAFIEIIEYESWDKYQQDNARVETDRMMRDYLERWRGLLLEPPKVELYAELTDSL
jgi:quinol monooxygenase YgiN